MCCWVAPIAFWVSFIVFRPLQWLHKRVKWPLAAATVKATATAEELQLELEEKRRARGKWKCSAQAAAAAVVVRSLSVFRKIKWLKLTLKRHKQQRRVIKKPKRSIGKGGEENTSQSTRNTHATIEIRPVAAAACTLLWQHELIIMTATVKWWAWVPRLVLRFDVSCNKFTTFTAQSKATRRSVPSAAAVAAASDSPFVARNIRQFTYIQHTHTHA